MSEGARGVIPPRRSNPPRLLHTDAHGHARPASQIGAQVETQKLCASPCDWDTDVDSFNGARACDHRPCPSVRALDMRNDSRACPPACHLSFHERRTTESPHVVRLGESRCENIVDHGHTRNRRESVEGYAQQQRMNRVAPGSRLRCLKQKRVIAREGIGRIRIS